MKPRRLVSGSRRGPRGALPGLWMNVIMAGMTLLLVGSAAAHDNCIQSPCVMPGEPSSGIYINDTKRVKVVPTPAAYSADQAAHDALERYRDVGSENSGGYKDWSWYLPGYSNPAEAAPALPSLFNVSYLTVASAGNVTMTFAATIVGNRRSEVGLVELDLSDPQNPAVLEHYAMIPDSFGGYEGDPPCAPRGTSTSAGPFAAGAKLGFYVRVDIRCNPSPSSPGVPRDTFYSVRELNDDAQARHFSLFQLSNQLMLSFEESRNGAGWGDYMFAVSPSEVGGAAFDLGGGAASFPDVPGTPKLCQPPCKFASSTCNFETGQCECNSAIYTGPQCSDCSCAAASGGKTGSCGNLCASATWSEHGRSVNSENCEPCCFYDTEEEADAATAEAPACAVDNYGDSESEAGAAVVGIAVGAGAGGLCLVLGAAAAAVFFVRKKRSGGRGDQAGGGSKGKRLVEVPVMVTPEYDDVSFGSEASANRRTLTDGRDDGYGSYSTGGSPGAEYGSPGSPGAEYGSPGSPGLSPGTGYGSPLAGSPAAGPDEYGEMPSPALSGQGVSSRGSGEYGAALIPASPDSPAPPGEGLDEYGSMPAPGV